MSIVKYVRGNTMLLTVTLTEKHEEGDPTVVDVEAYDSWAANVYRCGSVSKSKVGGVITGVDTEKRVTLLLPPTLVCGIYSVEIILNKEDIGRRSFEIPVFEVVETNGEADITYELIDGMRSADIDMQFQFVETSTIIGESAYEEWKQLPGNEDKTMQDFIDEVLDLNGITARCIAATENAEHLPYIGSDNYVYQWQNGAYVKTSTYVKGDKGDKGSTGSTGPRGPQGEPGPQGLPGRDGANGRDGVGVPTGGTTGQVLRKKSNTNYDTEWGTGGSEQVQSDWNQSDNTKVDYIKNKPTIPAAQIQSDWNQSSSSSADYIKNKPTIPAEVTESTVAGWGFTKNTGTYSKPSTGIPASDLSSAVQTSLGKADTALQSETDPTVPSWAKASSKPSYTASEVGAVPTTRTVNGKALSSDVILDASDVGALPDDTTIPTITFIQW